MTYQDDDPFAGGDGRPHYSWADRPVGHTVTGVVCEDPKVQQSRKFAGKGQVGDPDFWPDGNPKMETIWGMTVDGEDYTFHAPKPSSMLAAIGAAQQAVGARVRVGATLTVALTERRPTNKGNAQNIFAAKLEPTDAFAFAPAPQVETRQALPTPAVAPADNPIQALAALKEKIAPLIAAGLQPAQIAAVPGIVGPDGAPLTPELVSTILALP